MKKILTTLAVVLGVTAIGGFVAFADEEEKAIPPPPPPPTVVVPTTITPPPPPPVEKVCPPLDSGKIDTPSAGTTLKITAPDGKVITRYCVKAGSAIQGDGPEFVDVNPGQMTVTISHSSGKDISHYSAEYGDKPTPTTTIKPKPIVNSAGAGGSGKCLDPVKGVWEPIITVTAKSTGKNEVLIELDDVEVFLGPTDVIDKPFTRPATQAEEVVVKTFTYFAVGDPGTLGNDIKAVKPVDCVPPTTTTTTTTEPPPPVTTLPPPPVTTLPPPPVTTLPPPPETTTTTTSPPTTTIVVVDVMVCREIEPGVWKVIGPIGEDQVQEGDLPPDDPKCDDTTTTTEPPPPETTMPPPPECTDPDGCLPTAGSDSTRTMLGIAGGLTAAGLTVLGLTALARREGDEENYAGRGPGY